MIPHSNIQSSKVLMVTILSSDNDTTKPAFPTDLFLWNPKYYSLSSVHRFPFLGPLVFQVSYHVKGEHRVLADGLWPEELRICNLDRTVYTSLYPTLTMPWATFLRHLQLLYQKQKNFSSHFMKRNRNPQGLCLQEAHILGYLSCTKLINLILCIAIDSPTKWAHGTRNAILNYIIVKIKYLIFRIMLKFKNGIKI